MHYGAAPESDLRRVAYRLKEGTLYRITWPSLDRAPVSKPLESPLVANVETFEVRFSDNTRNTVTTWPVSGANSPLPPAIEVTLAVRGMGSFKRVFSGEPMTVPGRTQRGVALVTAIMIVAIVAAVAMKIQFAHTLWFRQMENVGDRGATDLLRRGALHWASVALLEDAAQNSIDHLGEPWRKGCRCCPSMAGRSRSRSRMHRGAST